MDLPPSQVELIRQVAAANPRTVVVVNAASPVTMDWADDVAAVVQLSYLGQETGDRPRGGAVRRRRRLRPPDHHVPPTARGRPGPRPLPRAGTGPSTYAEGVFVGLPPLRHPRRRPPLVLRARPVVHVLRLRRVDRHHSRRRPTVWRWCRSTSPTPAPAPDSEVVQVYVRPLDAPVARPDRELKAFEKVSARARRDHHGHRRPRRPRVRSLGPGPSCLARRGRHLRDPGRIVVPDDPPVGRVDADRRGHPPIARGR